MIWIFLLSGAFGPKLRELELSGPRLKRVTLDAFEGIDSYELLLAIRDSSLEELPMHFFTLFQNVAHWSLDLSNNKLQTLAPNVLYQNGTDWKIQGTSILQGTLMYFLYVISAFKWGTKQPSNL